MKVYRTPAGTYFEKQEDARRADRKFEAVEFPFSASPKADFVAWLNDKAVLVPDLLPPTYGEPGPGIVLELKASALSDAKFIGDGTPQPIAIAQPLPVQPSPAHSMQVLAFEDQFEVMPIATQLHYAALAVENARKLDLEGTAPAKAPQRYGDSK